MKKLGAVSDLRLKRIFKIHKVLRKSHRGWSAKELCEICREVDPGLNPALDERTIMNDLRFLRDELKAPLPERANKHHGYYYSETYSILEGLDNSYLGGLNEALALLRQLSKSNEFIGLEDLLLRLEQRVAVTSAEQNPVIEFDEAELLGRQHLIGLYNAIQKQAFLRITYQTFQGEEVMNRHILPLLLKEYNNRWVLVAWENGRDTPQNLPLDRIIAQRETAETFVHSKVFDSQTYFKNLLGTTKTDNEPQEVVLHFRAERAKYVETKKIHPTQGITWLANSRLEVRLFVELNRELEARILEFGKDVVVIEPVALRERIKDNLYEALTMY
ncbi:helix-turn-helix transcriptional regulator [Fibrella aquatilis]|uniref:WYL domain-containing protein n=1 Tax=Fibrella aquatilis TaxID=2817059 RepID=A0A939G5K3_9BACT|nr:WYL domain-containing protein [Fibrella aquatilis]MBO0932554.1 WYL domain-containing protein [Fibrella aquatilis]